MRNIVVAFMMLATLTAFAKDDDSKYLAGAVPEDENGLIVFAQKLAIDGVAKEQIYTTLREWAAAVAGDAIKDLRTRLLSEDKEKGEIIYRIEEWMVFRRTFLALDRSRFRYQLVINCADGEAEVIIRQISYYYEEDERGQNGKTYKAEEWISDKEALNKKKTKMYKYSAKFRRKTVDRVEELFNAARDAFETEEEQPTKPERKATKVVK